jgi:hypothetical protein
MRIAYAIAALLALPFLGSAAADHGCNGVVTVIATPVATLYLDDRSGGAPTLNHWLYLESNGEAGLQSGGESVILGGLDADPCAHANPDTLIF